MSNEHEIPLASDVILYDADCYLCRSLVEFARKHQGQQPIFFCPWQDWERHAKTWPKEVINYKDADILVIARDGTCLSGDAAWTYAVERYPYLGGVQWMAQRVGLASVVPQTVRRVGKTVRRFCSRCRR